MWIFFIFPWRKPPWSPPLHLASPAPCKMPRTVQTVNIFHHHSGWLLPIVPPVSWLISPSATCLSVCTAEGTDYISPQRAARIDTESLFNPIQSQPLTNERERKKDKDTGKSLFCLRLYYRFVFRGLHTLRPAVLPNPYRIMILAFTVVRLCQSPSPLSSDLFRIKYPSSVLPVSDYPIVYHGLSLFLAPSFSLSHIAV